MAIFKRDPMKAIEKERAKVENQLKKIREEKETKGVVKDNLRYLGLSPGGRYIGRDSGVALLWVVMVAILVVVGIVVFYNEKFTNLNEEFDMKLEELRNTYEELEEKETLLNETAEELEEKESREEKLTGEFMTIKSEKERLLAEKKQLEENIDALENELADAHAKITGLEKQVSSLKKKIEELEK